MKRLSWLLAIPLLFVSISCSDVDTDNPDVTSPTMLAAKTMDLDGDGSVETIQMIFDDKMADETLETTDFSFAPTVGAVGFQFNLNGDKSHNSILHLSFPDGFVGLDVGLDLVYISGSLSDTDGNLLPDTLLDVQPAGSLP